MVPCPQIVRPRDFGREKLMQRMSCIGRKTVSSDMLSYSSLTVGDPGGGIRLWCSPFNSDTM